MFIILTYLHQEEILFLGCFDESSGVLWGGSEGLLTENRFPTVEHQKDSVFMTGRDVANVHYIHLNA